MEHNIASKTLLSYPQLHGDWGETDEESKLARKNEVAFRSAVISSFLKEQGLSLSLARVEYGPYVSHYVLSVSDPKEIAILQDHLEELGLRFGEHPLFLLKPPSEHPQEISLEVDDIYPYYLLLGDVYDPNPLRSYSIPLGKKMDGNNLALDLEDSPLLYVHGGLSSGKSGFFEQVLLALLEQNSPAGLSLAFFAGPNNSFKDVSLLPNLVGPVATSASEKEALIQTLLHPQNNPAPLTVVFFAGVSGLEAKDLSSLMVQSQKGGLSLILLDDDLTNPLAKDFAQKANASLFFPSYQDREEVEKYLQSQRGNLLVQMGDALYQAKDSKTSSLRLAEPLLSRSTFKLALEEYTQASQKEIRPVTSYALEDSFASYSNTLASLVEYLQKKSGRLLHYALLPSGAFRFREDVSFSPDTTLQEPSPLELVSSEKEEYRGPLYYLVSEIALASKASIVLGGEAYVYEKGHFKGKEKIKGDPLLPLELSLDYLKGDYRDVLEEEDLETILSFFRERYGKNILFIKDKVS